MTTSLPVPRAPDNETQRFLLAVKQAIEELRQGIGATVVTSGVTGGVAGVTTVNGRTGAVVLSAADILSGIIDPARLGGGTANSSTFLRGDSQFAIPAGGGGGGGGSSYFPGGW